MSVDDEYADDKSPSYRTGICCHADCTYLGHHDDEPCWGDVGVICEEPIGDDDYCWIHACAGHTTVFDGGKYKPEPTPPS